MGACGILTLRDEVERQIIAKGRFWPRQNKQKIANASQSPSCNFFYNEGKSTLHKSLVIHASSLLTASSGRLNSSSSFLSRSYNTSHFFRHHRCQLQSTEGRSRKCGFPSHAKTASHLRCKSAIAIQPQRSRTVRRPHSIALAFHSLQRQHTQPHMHAPDLCLRYVFSVRGILTFFAQLSNTSRTVENSYWQRQRTHLVWSRPLATMPPSSTKRPQRAKRQLPIEGTDDVDTPNTSPTQSTKRRRVNFVQWSL